MEDQENSKHWHKNFGGWKKLDTKWIAKTRSQIRSTEFSKNYT